MENAVAVMGHDGPSKWLKWLSTRTTDEKQNVNKSINQFGSGYQFEM